MSERALHPMASGHRESTPRRRLERPVTSLFTGITSSSMDHSSGCGGRGVMVGGTGVGEASGVGEPPGPPPGRMGVSVGRGVATGVRGVGPGVPAVGVGAAVGDPPGRVVGTWLGVTVPAADGVVAGVGEACLVASAVTCGVGVSARRAVGEGVVGGAGVETGRIPPVEEPGTARVVGKGEPSRGVVAAWSGVVPLGRRGLVGLTGVSNTIPGTVGTATGNSPGSGLGVSVRPPQAAAATMRISARGVPRIFIPTCRRLSTSWPIGPAHQRRESPEHRPHASGAGPKRVRPPGLGRSAARSQVQPAHPPSWTLGGHSDGSPT